MSSYLICGLALLLRKFSSLYSMNNVKSHNPMSASSIPKSLSNKRKLSKTPSLPLNVSESNQTHNEDYKISFN